MAAVEAGAQIYLRQGLGIQIGSWVQGDQTDWETLMRQWDAKIEDMICTAIKHVNASIYPAFAAQIGRAQSPP